MMPATLKYRGRYYFIVDETEFTAGFSWAIYVLWWTSGSSLEFIVLPVDRLAQFFFLALSALFRFKS